MLASESLLLDPLMLPPLMQATHQLLAGCVCKDLRLAADGCKVTVTVDREPADIQPYGVFVGWLKREDVQGFMEVTVGDVPIVASAQIPYFTRILLLVVVTRKL